MTLWVYEFEGLDFVRMKKKENTWVVYIHAFQFNFFISQIWLLRIMNNRSTVVKLSEKVHFILADKLPTVYDAAISLFSVANQPETNKMWVIMLIKIHFFIIK